MKRILIPFIILTIPSFFICPSSAQEKLRIVTPGIVPVSYENEGRISGYGTEIIVEVFGRLQRPIEISIVPGARALILLRSGEADALYALAKTVEREAFAVYTTEPLYDQPISVFVSNDSSITFDGDVKKLSAYDIGIIRGGRFYPEFDEALRKKLFPNIVEVNEYELLIRMLAANHIDVVIGPRYSVLFAAKELNGQDLLRELPTPLTETSPAYLALSKKGNAAHLAEQIDGILKGMKKDGTYDGIMRKYLY